jgi:Na+/melibiose symporter-like transporter
MVQKLGYALGSGLPLLILGWSGYASAGEQREGPLLALTVSYSIIPCVLVLIAAAMAWRYTLTADRHEAIRASIDARIAAETAAATPAGTDGGPSRP